MMAGGSPSVDGSAAPATITLSGGEACPTKQVALWRSGRLTDTVVTVEGATFAAHRLVLAAACEYFERHYDHEYMRDAFSARVRFATSRAARRAGGRVWSQYGSARAAAVWHPW